MPGPLSAPNGDVSLVRGMTTIKRWDDQSESWILEPISVREKMRRAGRLKTGKTDAKRRK